MISVKELRIGNLVKDENDNIWRKIGRAHV